MKIKFVCFVKEYLAYFKMRIIYVIVQIIAISTFKFSVFANDGEINYFRTGTIICAEAHHIATQIEPAQTLQRLR